MSKRILLFLSLMGLSVLGCASGSGGFGDTVLQDFGIRERPEGYVSNTDRVFERLDEVGEAELQRLNTENRRGEIKADTRDPLRTQYYKEIKVYENYYPLEVDPATRSSRSRGGYVGYIEYGYQMHQSPRYSTRTEASAAAADLPTGERGRETRRYRFSTSGVWTGGAGELVR